MCGILTAISKEKLSRDELKALRELFVVTTLRGIDSTGILIGDTIDKNIYRLWKDVGNFYDCVGDPSAIDSFKANLVMGHCRWAFSFVTLPFVAHRQCPMTRLALNESIADGSPTQS